MEAQRHLPLFALDQFEVALMAVAEPVDELHGVAHGGREQQRADVRRQQAERQFPDDAPFGIGEAVKLVHHDGADFAEIEGRPCAAGDSGGFRPRRPARGRRDFRGDCR